MAKRIGDETGHGPAILWLGGPDGVRNATRIGADFGSVMLGPWPNGYEDFDIIVFWPDRDTFLLPETHDEWERFRTKHDHAPCLPAISPRYWGFRAVNGRRCLDLPNVDDLIARSSAAPERLSSDYAKALAMESPLDYGVPSLTDKCQSETDALLLERLLWWRCAVRLRAAVLAMTKGTVLVLVLPDVEFDAAWCCAWLSPWIGERPGPRPRARTTRNLAAGSLEALACLFPWSGSKRAGQLCLETVDPILDEPVPLQGHCQLGALLMHPEGFTIRGSSDNLRNYHPGWGVPADITTWPLQGAPHAILLTCMSGGAVVVPATSPAGAIIPALRRWYLERQDPKSANKDRLWSKNLFRFDARRNVWVVKIAEEDPVELPGGLRGCHYFHKLLQPENRASGVDSLFLHYELELPGIARGEKKSRQQWEAMTRLKRRLQEIDSELKEIDDATRLHAPDPALVGQDFGGEIERIGGGSYDPAKREGLETERETICKEILDLGRRGKSAAEDSARNSVREALDLVCGKIRIQRGAKLTKHLSGFEECALVFKYTGGLDWELD